MIRTLAIALALALAACETATPTPQHAPRPVAKTAPVAQPKKPPVASAGPAATEPKPDAKKQPRVAALPPAAAPSAPAPEKPKPAPKVIGLSLGQTRTVLGAPASETDEPPAKVWHYRNPACELDVFFYMDVSRNGFYALQVEAHPAGGATIGSEECVRQVQASAQPS